MVNREERDQAILLRRMVNREERDMRDMSWKTNIDGPNHYPTERREVACR